MRHSHGVPTLPRTDSFAFLAGSIPSDASGWVHGDHIATDKASSAYGAATRWGARDFGVASTVADTPARSWFAWRVPTAQQAVRVRGRFFWRHVEGERQDVRLGLMARLQSISSTASGPPARWYAGDAYTLDVEVDTTAETATLGLYRVDQGVPSLLDELEDFAWPEAREKELELRITNRGNGSVRLELRVADEEVLRVIDEPATALTAAGAYGWMASDARTADGRTRSAIRSFTAAQYASGNVILEDDYARPNRIDATPAYYVRSLWGPFAGLEQVSGAIRPTTASEDFGRIALAQIRPTDPDYTVEATFTFASGAHWGGLVARASKASTAADLAGFTGYLARLRVDTSTDNLEVLKVVAGTVIDTVTASVSGLSTGVAVALLLDVSGDTEVVVKAKVNGTLRLTYRDELVDRHTRAGQAGIYMLSATSSPGVSLTAFELDDPPSADDTVTVLELPDEDAGIVEPEFAIVDLTAQVNGSRTTFTLPSQPSGDGVVALFHNGRRLAYDTTPAADQYSVDAVGLEVTTGFTPAVGDTLAAEYPLVGNSSYTMNEVPTGSVNGSNRLFLLSTQPHAASQVRVYVEGVRLRHIDSLSLNPDQYSLPTSLQLLVGVAPSDHIVVDYRKASAGAGNPVFGQIPAGSIDGVNRTFTPATAANSPSQAGVYLNGYRLGLASGEADTTEFAAQGNAFVLGDTPSGSDWVLVDSIQADNFLAELELAPDYSFTVEERFLTLSATFAYDYEQTLPVMEQSRERWPVVASGLTTAQHAALVAFLRARKGPLTQFLWTPPDATEPVSVHVAESGFSSRKVGPDVFTVSFVLERVMVLASEAA